MDSFRRLRILKNRRGVTLVEIVFAMCILLMCAFLFVAAFPVATQSRTGADHRSRAVMLAQRQLEATRDAGYNVLLSSTGLQARGIIDTTNGISPYSCTNVTLGTGESISGTLLDGAGTLEVTPEPGFSELLRITVTVTWTERSQTRQVSITTLMSQV